jgi:hypothetical protein
LLGHWLSFNPSIIKSNRRNDGSALARRAKPARAKTIRTIGNLLIEIRTGKNHRQPNQLWQNQKNAEVA